jgi:peroxiredoxin
MMLSVGQEAPDFELTSTKHKDKAKLSDYRGRKNVLLAFFPLAFTPG